jgi:ribosomal protein S12 methylthiotransferase accessory factor
VSPLTGDVLAALCARVEAAGSSVYAVDVTAQDVAALGLVVTKVVAPELCALDVVHRARFLGGRRLYEVPVALGFRSTPLAESELNPYPHPFP